MHPWQLSDPLDAVIFDCDGTLSQVEGIDVLASMNHVSDAVRKLTEEAMGSTGLNAELYARRLDLVRPTEAQMSEVGEIYASHLTPDVDRVIEVLDQLNKPVYVISAGLSLPVEALASHLGIPKARVFAVDVHFNELGEYVDYDHLSPITHQRGKGVIIQRLKKTHPRLLHIGDGMNDLEVADQVTRFVGYGGAFYRERIARDCEFYINTPSLLSILPLCLTEQEINELNESAKQQYQQGLADIQAGRVLL